MTSLIVCRHGNTFAPDQVPTRAGLRTDIPLVESGFRQAERLGVYLAQKALIPDIVFTSRLQRTQQTAKTILEVLNAAPPVREDPRFNEIDYGPDENRPEDSVIERIGRDALERWNREAVPPPGWNVAPGKIKQDWDDFAAEILEAYPEQTVLVVTSNGVGRFAPYITGDFEGFRRTHPLKLKTGALAVFEYDGTDWQVMEWNVRPE